MSCSDINPLRFARMHLEQSGCLGTAERFKSAEINDSVPNPPFMSSSPLTVDPSPKTLGKENVHGATTTGPKFALSSLVGPHIRSNTESYGIHCLDLPPYSKNGYLTSSFASAEFLGEERMYLVQSAAGSTDGSSELDPLSLAFLELTARTIMVRRTWTPQYARSSGEEVIAESSEDSSSNFDRLTYRAGPSVSIVGEKCTCKSFVICRCCGNPDQSQIENDSNKEDFADGQKGPSDHEEVEVYYERLTTALAELGVTMSRHVREKSSGEREVFIAQLISRDYFTMVPSLTNELEELDMEWSKHDVLPKGPSSHSKCSPKVGSKSDLDTLPLPEVNPKPDLKGEGKPSAHCEEKVVVGRRTLQKSAPIPIPKRLRDDDAELCWQNRTSYAYSMTEGVGRTLKGRDLIQVRNHVLRLTGFIEE